MTQARLILLILLITAAAPSAFPQSSIKAAQDAYDSGSVLRTKKDLQGALNALTRAVQLDPNFSDAWRQRGLTYRELGQMKEAMADIERAIQVDPRNGKALNARAIIKYAQGDYAGAITDSTRCIELEPGFSGGYMNRGNCRYQMKELRAALADFNKAASVDPTNALAIYNSGIVHADLKEYGDARADFKKSLEADPNHAYAAQARERIAKLPNGGGIGSTLSKIAQAASAVMNLPETLKNPSPAPAASAPEAATQSARDPRASTESATSTESRASTAGASAPKAELPQAGRPVVEAENVARISMPKDPLDRSQWPSGDVLWEAAKTLPLPVNAKTQAIRVPGHLDFNHMSPAIYGSAVSTAKEAMRLIQGPLPVQEQKAFDAKWAPYFDYPSSEVIDYFNKLNPLLARFLDARGGFNVALQALHKALAAAGGAGMENDPHSVASAISAARLQKSAMDGYQKAMADAEAAISGLGPMPNPYEVRARHAKSFTDAVTAAKPQAKPAPVPVDTSARYWVLQKVTFDPPSRQSKGEECNYSYNVAESSASANYTCAFKDGKTLNFSDHASWDIIPRAIRQPMNLKIKASVSGTPSSRPGSDQSKLEVCAGGEDVRYGGCVTGTRQNGGASGELLLMERSAWQPGEGNTYNFRVAVTLTNSNTTFVTYHYKDMLLSAAQLTEIQAKAAQQVAAVGAAQKDAQANAAAQAASDKTRIEALAFQREMSAYFERQQKRAAADLTQATDPAARKELSVQVLAYDADRAAADDNAVYLETGQWQRTHTLYDEYNLTVMANNAREEAARIREPEILANATLHQIDLMPPELRDSVRATWESKVNATVIMNRDTATMKRAAADVAAQVRAYWNGVSGRENDKAFVMDGLTKTAQATEIGAGMALLGVAGAAGAGAGLTGGMLWAAETLTGAAYGGATGYVAGGPDEAARRSLQWAGTLGFAASEAIDGYAKSGDAATALKQGVTALVLAKTMEIGIKWGAGKLSPAGPTGQEAAEVAKFERGMASGKQAIQRAEKAELALSQAVGKGASQAEINRLTMEAERHAAALNADWYAKFQLKLKGSSPIGRAFDQRINQVYQKTMPDFTRELEKLGYDVSRMQFRPMRNPSSAGTVSMDLDLALVETPGMVIARKGTPVSRGRFQDDAQAVWDRVYQQKTGQDARRSLLNITNSKHQEAFTMKLLEKNPRIGSLTPAEVSQAADVLRVKVSDIPLPTMAKFVENSRGLEKEMRTKVLPYFADQAARSSVRGETAKAQALRESQKYWQGIYDQLADIGKKEHAPVELWRLQQQLKQSTGGKSLWEIADALGVAWEATAKVK